MLRSGSWHSTSARSFMCFKYAASSLLSFTRLSNQLAEVNTLKWQWNVPATETHYTPRDLSLYSFTLFYLTDIPLNAVEQNISIKWHQICKFSQTQEKPLNINASIYPPGAGIMIFLYHFIFILFHLYYCYFQFIKPESRLLKSICSYKTAKFHGWEMLKCL